MLVSWWWIPWYKCQSVKQIQHWTIPHRSFHFTHGGYCIRSGTHILDVGPSRWNWGVVFSNHLTAAHGASLQRWGIQKQQTYTKRRWWMYFFLRFLGSNFGCLFLYPYKDVFFFGQNRRMWNNPTIPSCLFENLDTNPVVQAQLPLA